MFTSSEYHSITNPEDDALLLPIHSMTESELETTLIWENIINNSSPYYVITKKAIYKIKETQKSTITTINQLGEIAWEQLQDLLNKHQSISHKEINSYIDTLLSSLSKTSLLLEKKRKQPSNFDTSHVFLTHPQMDAKDLFEFLTKKLRINDRNLTIKCEFKEGKSSKEDSCYLSTLDQKEKTFKFWEETVKKIKQFGAPPPMTLRKIVFDLKGIKSANEIKVDYDRSCKGYGDSDKIIRTNKEIYELITQSIPQETLDKNGISCKLLETGCYFYKIDRSYPSISTWNTIRSNIIPTLYKKHKDNQLINFIIGDKASKTLRLTSTDLSADEIYSEMQSIIASIPNFRKEVSLKLEHTDAKNGKDQNKKCSLISTRAIDRKIWYQIRKTIVDSIPFNNFLEKQTFLKMKSPDSELKKNFIFPDKLPKKKFIEQLEEEIASIHIQKTLEGITISSLPPTKFPKITPHYSTQNPNRMFYQTNEGNGSTNTLIQSNYQPH